MVTGQATRLSYSYICLVTKGLALKTIQVYMLCGQYSRDHTKAKKGLWHAYLLEDQFTNVILFT